MQETFSLDNNVRLNDMALNPILAIYVSSPYFNKYLSIYQQQQPRLLNMGSMDPISVAFPYDDLVFTGFAYYA